MIQDDILFKAEEVQEDFLRQLRKASPGPIIMLSHRPVNVGKDFPVTSNWVEGWGRIEVGRQPNAGFVARAFDDGGLVFEDDTAKTLAEAIAALEQGLVKWFNEQGIEVD